LPVTAKVFVPGWGTTAQIVLVKSKEPETLPASAKALEPMVPVRVREKAK